MSRTAYAVMLSLQVLILGLLLFVAFRVWCPPCVTPAPAPPASAPPVSAPPDLSSIDTSNWKVETTPSGETVLVSPEVVVETLPTFHRKNNVSVTKNVELGNIFDGLLPVAERGEEISAEEE